jgi:hypothetical protein
MILYDLICDKDHTFESWFKNSAAAEKVLKAKQSPCPVCGSGKVRKAPMAPRLSKQSSELVPAAPEGEVMAPPAKPQPPAGHPLADMAQAMEKAATALAQLRDTIEKTFDNVGEKFPEEARRIHYGDAPERPIYGDATLEEAEELHEEGIKVAAIPWPKRKKSN